MHVLTYLFMHYDAHNPRNIEREILSIAKKHKIDLKTLPKYNIISETIPTTSMPQLYKAVDAYVLPTKGEGYGLPYVPCCESVIE